ncbi:MAG: hypothetical protein J1E03_11665 [Acetatifactor sp.]|nr:hypothetical protein [Acetatifactor sp.]
MWECECGREPLDYRLIWLRFLRKLWVIPIAILAGMMLVGTVHYCSRTVAKGGRTYQSESIFYIDFAENAQGEEYDYYNFFTWGEVIHTDFFMDYVYGEMEGKYSRDELATYITATVDSDVRYLYVRCNTHFPELSVKLASVMETIVPQFAEIREEIEIIEVAKKGSEAKDSSKLRLGKAYFLGACLGLAAAVLGILIVLILDTGIYLPSTIEKRYHVVCLGAPFLPEFAPNWQLYLKDALKVALVHVDKGDSKDIMGYGKQMEDIASVSSNVKPEIIICENPVEHSEELEKIRNCDKTILCLRAGRRNHETFTRLLEQLGRQGIPVTGAILISADEKLISAYYRSKV